MVYTVVCLHFSKRYPFTFAVCSDLGQTAKLAWLDAWNRSGLQHDKLNQACAMPFMWLAGKTMSDS